jgi:mono/diheme cytochrome c family protein
MDAATDPHPRVRLEALVAASWLPADVGIPIVKAAGKLPLDYWMAKPFEAAIAHLEGRNLGVTDEGTTLTSLEGEARELFQRGEEIYHREGFCVTCHQPDGLGLSASQFPPLAGTDWATGSKERLIKLSLNGMIGPVEVLGKTYPGQVPMTPFGGLLNDEEIASVLTFVRNAFGNEASVVLPEEVGQVRGETADKEGFYTAEELLEMHPIE